MHSRTSSRLVKFAMVLIVLVACDKNESNSPGNHAPNAPSNPTPADGSTGMSVDDDLSWTCSDPDGDPLTYDVYFGTASSLDSSDLVSEGQSETSYDPGTLTEDTTYFWKVIAYDNNQHSTEGDVWSVTTTAGGGQPDYTIVVRGKEDCIFLDTSAALHFTIPAGTYRVEVSGDAKYGPNAQQFFHNVLLRYSDTSYPGNPDVTVALPIGSTATLNMRDSYGPFAFFADWSATDDNTGSAQIEFYGEGSTQPDYSIVVQAGDNCILLDNSAAVRATIPAGTYRVDVSGDAMYVTGSQQLFHNILIRYSDALNTDNSDITTFLSVGSSTTMNMLNSYGPFVFFTDWSTLNDNGGTVEIDFFRQ